MKNLNKIKQNNGITLIALVITIIVLLILAGITIATLTGDNGIITRANEAKVETRRAQVEEEIELWKAENLLREHKNEEQMSWEELLESLIEENLVKEDEIDREAKTITIGKSVISYKDYVEDTIYIYTADGYITGLKPEYIMTEDEYYGYRNNTQVASVSKKYASMGENIKIASYYPPEYYYLINELGGILKIPNEIEGTKIIGISDSAFTCLHNVTKVEISSGIQTIGNGAFWDCSLSSIEIPETVTSIGDSAFYWCQNLTSIEIPGTVTSMGNAVFVDCYNLSSVIIQNGVESIGDEAFWYCKSLTSIEIPNSVTTMGQDAFQGWTSSQTIKVPFNKNDTIPSGWDSRWEGYICSATIKYLDSED